MKTTRDMGSPQWTKATIEHVAGPLEGLTNVRWIPAGLAIVGKRVKACVGSGAYVVRAIGESVNTYSPPRD